MTYSPPPRGSFIRRVKEMRDAARAAGGKPPVPRAQPPAEVGLAPSRWHGPESGNGYLPADNARIDAAGRKYQKWRKDGCQVPGPEHRPERTDCGVHEVGWAGAAAGCWADGADGVRCGTTDRKGGA